MQSTLELLNAVLTIGVILSYAYIAYAALMIRKALMVGQHRRQAFGVGFLAAVFALNQVAYYIPEDGAWGLLGLGIFAVFALGLLYWVDTSVLAARRSDPLYRDTLRWSLLRRGIWAVSMAGLIGAFALSLAIPPNASFQPPVWLDVAFTVAFFFPIYAAAVSGVIVMPMAARRSRDLVFRRHLEFLFVFIAIQLALAGGVGQLFQSSNGTTALSNIIDGVALVIGLPPLFLRVKKLVPLYRFSDEGASIGNGSSEAVGELPRV